MALDRSSGKSSGGRGAPGMHAAAARAPAPRPARLPSVQPSVQPSDLRDVPPGLPFLRAEPPPCSVPSVRRHFDRAGMTHQSVAATKRAQAVCAACPYLAGCKDYALTTGQEWGIWGGTTPKERIQWWAKNGGRPVRYSFGGAVKDMGDPDGLRVSVDWQLRLINQIKGVS